MKSGSQALNGAYRVGGVLLLLVSDVYNMYRYEAVPHVSINMKAFTVPESIQCFYSQPGFMYEPYADC